MFAFLDASSQQHDASQIHASKCSQQGIFIYFHNKPPPNGLLFIIYCYMMLTRMCPCYLILLFYLAGINIPSCTCLVWLNMWLATLGDWWTGQICEKAFICVIFQWDTKGEGIYSDEFANLCKYIPTMVSTILYILSILPCQTLRRKITQWFTAHVPALWRVVFQIR